MSQKPDDNLAIPCIQCGYDLRVTNIDAVCPECGTPARHSKGGYRVDGDCLVVYPNANLPARCYRTNHTGAECALPGMLGTVGQLLIQPWSTRATLQAESPAHRVRQATWPFMVGLLGATLTAYAMPEMSWAGLLVGGWTALTIDNAIQLLSFSRANVYFYVCIVGIVRTSAIWLGMGLLSSLGAMALWYVLAALLRRVNVSDGIGAVILVGIPLCCLVIPPLVMMYRLDLRAVKHIDGEFWIKGCCPAYLQSCEIERQRIIDDAAAQHAVVHDSTSAPPTAEQRSDANDQG